MFINSEPGKVTRQIFLWYVQYHQNFPLAVERKFKMLKWKCLRSRFASCSSGCGVLLRCTDRCFALTFIVVLVAVRVVAVLLAVAPFAHWRSVGEPGHCWQQNSVFTLPPEKMWKKARGKTQASAVKRVKYLQKGQMSGQQGCMRCKYLCITVEGDFIWRRGGKLFSRAYLEACVNL
jgi:hypothetical protein